MPQHDPNTKSADFSHFRDTLLDNTIRHEWEFRKWMVPCAGGAIYMFLQPGLRRHYGREAPDRVAADLQAQGAACVPTDAHTYMCVYRQVVHCKTRGLLVRNADYRSDIELRIELRDDPDDNKRIVLEEFGKTTKFEPRD